MRHTGLAALAALLLFAAGCMNGAPADAAGKLEQGQYFTLKDTDGNSVGLADTLRSNKAVLVTFWASWCPPCREELPELIRLQGQFKDRGFRILAVNAGESKKKVASFLKKNPVNYTVLLDEDMQAVRSFGVTGVPSNYVLAPDGTIVKMYSGFNPDMEREIERLI
ncbi:MAG: hypothetical protein A3D28_01405 [Omnitrophica bacterium RIFCSPHIGHO2_02_FULL_63_14]|nr:MAG: hypothetical protein A3D28_01405 [Omnitrophica bacterium RIFCSPHIGHO2_02_FULL_63_14]